MQSYVNKYGTLYYLPEFGPPVRWLTTASRKSRGDDALAPAVYFFECDEKDLGRRAIQLWRDGRVALACPGGPDGDSLPEGALPNVDRWNADNPDIVAREITGEEFVSLWAALSRISIAICLASC